MASTTTLRTLTISDKNSKWYQRTWKIYSELMPYFDSVSFYGGQPVSLMPEALFDLVQRRENDLELVYNVTPKLDGLRMLMLIHPQIGVTFIDRKMTFFRSKNDNDNILINYSNDIYLFDGEFFGNDLFFVFDVLYYNTPHVNFEFEYRHQILMNLINGNANNFHEITRSIYTRTQIQIYYKLYMSLNDFANNNNLYEQVCQRFIQYYKNVIEPFPKFRFDGLIFTPRFTKYIVRDNWKYPFNILYKWKPNDTIDFKIDPQSMHAIVISKNNTDVYFKPERDPIIIDNPKNIEILPNVIYECSFDVKKKRFVVLFSRTDKTVPNSLKTATSAWYLLNNPIEIDLICTLLKDDEKLEKNKKKALDTLPVWKTRDYILNNHIYKYINEHEPVSSRFLYQLPYNNTKKNEFECRIGTMSKQGFFQSNVKYTHFQWLKNTLEVQGYIYIFTQTLDVIQKNIRTTYYYPQENINNLNDLYGITSVSRSIQKEVQDERFLDTIVLLDEKIRLSDIYNYMIKLSVSSENEVTNKNANVLHEQRKERKKRRWSYHFNDQFVIDLTHVITTNYKYNKIIKQFDTYEVEIELINSTDFQQEALNKTIQYVLTNLYGKSQII